MPKGTDKTKKEKKHFLKDVKAELKRVIWPTPKQLINNTIAVITIVIITAIIVGILDFAFEQLNTYGIEKIKSSVEKRNEETNSQADTNTVEDVNDTNTIEDSSDTNQVQNNEVDANNIESGVNNETVNE